MIEIEKTPTRLAERNLDPAAFGTVFCDHMLVAEYRAGSWAAPRIRPYGPLEITPSINGLHYGLATFEGLKAFRTVRDEVVVFRQRDNARRLAWSCRRLTLPEVPEDLFVEGIRSLVGIDRAWVPAPEEGSLYIRPLVFGTDANLRVRPPETALFVILTCAVGAYFAQPLRLIAEEHYARAFPGGTGDTKAGGNYAGALLADHEAHGKGHHGALWLDAESHTLVEEAGAMNVFFVIDDRVITPPLSGTILPGVTRDSIITLLRDRKVTVEERPISVTEIFDAHRQGVLRECFGAGTAAVVAPVGAITHAERTIELDAPTSESISTRVKTELADMRAGRVPDRFGWLMKVA